MGGDRRRGSRLNADALQARAAALTRALTNSRVAVLATRLRQHVPREVVPTAHSRLAAVAAVLRVVSEPELLFIKRADAEHDPWSGHVAFPGGRIETRDASLEATAIRETFEELALDLTQGRMLGQLDDLAPRSRSLPPIIVRPFVAVVAPDVSFVASREVASMFWVPLSQLQHEDAKTEHVLQVNGVTARFPAYRIDTHIVWGLTERIVRQLLLFLEL